MDQENADAIDTEVVVDAWRGYPWSEYLELEAGVAGVDGPNGKERKQELGNADNKAEAAYPDVVVVAEKEDREGPEEGKEKEYREDGAVQKH